MTTAPPALAGGAEHRLGRHGIDPGRVRPAFDAITPAVLDDLLEALLADPRLQAMCERYDFLDKLVLHDMPDAGVRIRLHLYRDGYYDRPHNHRWSFASRIICGQYGHRIFGTDDAFTEDTDPATLRPLCERTETPGSTYALHHAIVHTVQASGGTISLLIRGRRPRTGSSSSTVPPGARSGPTAPPARPAAASRQDDDARHPARRSRPSPHPGRPGHRDEGGACMTGEDMQGMLFGAIETNSTLAETTLVSRSSASARSMSTAPAPTVPSRCWSGSSDAVQRPGAHRAAP